MATVRLTGLGTSAARTLSNRMMPNIANTGANAASGSAHVSRCEVDVHEREADRDATLERDEREPIRLRESGKRPSGRDDRP